jgi:hypothetical protein
VIAVVFLLMIARAARDAGVVIETAVVAAIVAMARVAVVRRCTRACP